MVHDSPVQVQLHHILLQRHYINTQVNYVDKLHEVKKSAMKNPAGMEQVSF